MTGEITNLVAGVMPRFEGYVYPNEAIPHPLWGFLIVLYPYITGLVAGAFIMASLVRVFKVQALEPVYRLAMLTALCWWTRNTASAAAFASRPAPTAAAS